MKKIAILILLSACGEHAAISTQPEIKTMEVVQASRETCEKIRQGQNPLLITGVKSDSLLMINGDAASTWGLVDNVVTPIESDTIAIGTFCTVEISSREIVSVTDIVSAPAPTCGGAFQPPCHNGWW